MNHFEKLAKLKELYPDDVARIEVDEQRVRDLLKRQDYANLDVTQELLALCRKDVLVARKKLATDRSLSEQAHAELWFIIESRLWFVKIITRDFDAELAQLDRDLEAELSV